MHSEGSSHARSVVCGGGLLMVPACTSVRNLVG